MGFFERNQGGQQPAQPATPTWERNNQQPQGNYWNQNNATSEGYAQPQTLTDINAFVRETYRYFAASLLAASVGAYVGMQMVAQLKGLVLVFGLVNIGPIFALHAVRHKPGINTMVLFAFTFISGLTISPLLMHTLGLPGGGTIVTNALLMTSVAFGGLTLFAMNTTRDFTGMGKMLFITLIIVVVASIANIFFQSPLMQLAIAGVSAILFSLFILHDTQNIINGAYDSPITAAATLFLDFFNLFVSLLQILGIFGGNDE